MALIEVGTACRALEGETHSGDRHLVQPFPGGVLVAVIDGLGHGEEASRAAEAAISVLERDCAESIVRIIQRCHERVVATRGVVLSLASFNGREDTMTWLGIGNVESVLLRGPQSAGQNARDQVSLLLRGGVVGGRLPSLLTSVLPVKPGDVLVMATDGVRTNFAHDNSRLGGSPQELAEYILRRYQKKSDDALVLVARYLGEGS